MAFTASRAPCRDCVRCVLRFASLLLNLALAILGQAFGLHLLVGDNFPEGAAHSVAAHVQNR